MTGDDMGACCMMNIRYACKSVVAIGHTRICGL